MISQLLDLQRNLAEAYPCNCNGCFGAWLQWVADVREEQRDND